MDENHDEYILYALQEGVDVAPECEYNHRDEEKYRKPLERFLQGRCNFRKEAGGKYAQHEWNSEEYEYGLEDVPERDAESRDFACDLCVTQVQVSPDEEIGRGHHDCKCGADCGQGHRELDVCLGKRGHEVGDVPAGARGHEYHSECHHRRYRFAEAKREKEGECRKQYELADHSEDYGFRLSEYVCEYLRLDPERDAVHHEGEYDVYRVHSACVQAYLDAVYCLSCFESHFCLFFRFCSAATRLQTSQVTNINSYICAF